MHCALESCFNRLLQNQNSSGQHWPVGKPYVQHPEKRWFHSLFPRWKCCLCSPLVFLELIDTVEMLGDALAVPSQESSRWINKPQPILKVCIKHRPSAPFTRTALHQTSCAAVSEVPFDCFLRTVGMLSHGAENRTRMQHDLAIH